MSNYEHSSEFSGSTKAGQAHCLAIVGGELKADSDETSFMVYPFLVPEEIWRGARPELPSDDEQWLNSKLDMLLHMWLRDSSKLPKEVKKLLNSKQEGYREFFIERYAPATSQNDTYPDQFIQLFKQAVVKQRSKLSYFGVWFNALQWGNRYNAMRTAMWYPMRISPFNPMSTPLLIPHFWTEFCPPTTVRLIDLPELAEYFPHLEIPE